MQEFGQFGAVGAVPHEDVVGVVEIVMDDGGIGGDEFFVKADGFKHAQRQAVMLGVEKIHQHACFLRQQQGLAVGQRVPIGEIVHAVQPEFAAGFVQIFGGDAEIHGQPQILRGLIEGADVGNALFGMRADEEQAAVVFVRVGQAVKIEAGGGDELGGVFGAAADVVGVKEQEAVKIVYLAEVFA